MRALNLQRKKVRKWWMESEAKCRDMEQRAEWLYKMRAFIMRRKQKHMDNMHRVAYATHMANALDAACKSVGVELEWVAAKSRLGNLLRGQGRSEKRADVFRILRARGYTYPEIALAFDTNASTVQTTMRIFADGLTRTHNGA